LSEDFGCFHGHSFISLHKNSVFSSNFRKVYHVIIQLALYFVPKSRDYETLDNSNNRILRCLAEEWCRALR